MRVAIFNAGWNARQAPLSAAATKRPLIVLSHGTGGGAAGMAWLAETLASNGYIVAAVNHHGTPRPNLHTSFTVHPGVGTAEGYFGPHR